MVKKKRKRHTYEVNLDNREYTAKEISIITGKSASNIRTICRKGILEVENINKKKSEDFIINGWNYNEYHNGYEIFNPHFRLKNMNIRVLNEDTMVFESSKVSNCFISGKKEVYEVKLENGYKIKCTENHRIFTNEGWKTLKDINIKHNNGITSYDKHSFKVCTNGLNITKEWLEEQRELGKSLTQVCNENKINFKSLSTLSEKFGIYWRKKVLINENLQYKDKQWLQEKLQEGLFSTEIALICNSTSDRIKKQIKKFGLQGNRYVWTSRKEV